MQTSKRILFAILNWGLGHATRCIPLIKELIRQQQEVIIASDGRALALLKEEFPHLQAIELPAYEVTYKTDNMIWNMAWQAPKIARAIYLEHKKVAELVDLLKIDAIISDNRFGCYHKKLKTVFITHQINIKVPNKLLNSSVQWLNRNRIKKFGECWVPDFEEAPNLSAELSHNHSLTEVKYLGCLSRMQRYERPKKYDIISILSGPEPQRSFLEEALLKQLEKLSYKCLIIRGITEQQAKEQYNSNITIVNYLTAQALNDAVMESDFVISRSGYSTLMDLVVLKKPAVLIPTPGQTEQEYLAMHFEKDGNYHFQRQRNLNIETAIEQLRENIVSINIGTTFPTVSYPSIVHNFVESL